MDCAIPFLKKLARQNIFFHKRLHPTLPLATASLIQATIEDGIFGDSSLQIQREAGGQVPVIGLYNPQAQTAEFSAVAAFVIIIPTGNKKNVAVV